MFIHFKNWNHDIEIKHWPVLPSIAILAQVYCSSCVIEGWGVKSPTFHVEYVTTIRYAHKGFGEARNIFARRVHTDLCARKLPVKILELL